MEYHQYTIKILIARVQNIVNNIGNLSKHSVFSIQLISRFEYNIR